MLEKKATFAERIKDFRHQNNLTLDELSKKIGKPAQTLNRYELGQRVPKVDIANDIAGKIGVSALWLQGYDVPQASDEKPTAPELSAEEQEAVSLLAGLDPAAKAHALQLLRSLAALQGKEPGSRE